MPARSYALVSMVAPFFPGEAQKRFNASSTMVGLIIAAYPLAKLASAPYWAAMATRHGRMPIYCLGVCALKTNLLWFVFFTYNQSGWFVAHCLVLVGTFSAS